MKKLKNCPFCGKTANPSYTEFYRDTPFGTIKIQKFYVLCSNCHASVGLKAYDNGITEAVFGTVTSAIESWNSRKKKEKPRFQKHPLLDLLEEEKTKKEKPKK